MPQIAHLASQWRRHRPQISCSTSPYFTSDELESQFRVNRVDQIEAQEYSQVASTQSTRSVDLFTNQHDFCRVPAIDSEKDFPKIEVVGHD